jgi:hypothetical protein
MLDNTGLLEARSIRASFDAGAGVTGEVRIAMPGVAEARHMADTFEEGLEQIRGTPFGPVFAGMTVGTDRADMVLTIELSADQLEKLVAIFRSFGVGP